MNAQGGSRGRWIWYLLAGLGALGVVLLLTHLLPGRLQSEQDNQRLVYLVALLALVGGGGLVRFARQPGPSLRRSAAHLAIWIGIGLVLLLGYGYRQEIGDAGHRLSALLLPAEGQAVDAQTMRFTVEADHQFHVKGLVAGAPVYFLVDTGASDVLLSQADARRVGIDPATLVYNQLYTTASGTAHGAAVTLSEIVIGNIRVSGVNASVSEGPMDSSLLGMSFLGRLQGYEVSGDTLILRQ
jgi:aspartyl protease family protein